MTTTGSGRAALRAGGRAAGRGVLGAFCLLIVVENQRQDIDHLPVATGLPEKV